MLTIKRLFGFRAFEDKDKGARMVLLHYSRKVRKKWLCNAINKQWLLAPKRSRKENQARRRRSGGWQRQEACVLHKQSINQLGDP